MSQIVEYKLPDGQTVLIESVNPPTAGGEGRAAIETIGKYLNNGGTPADLEDKVSPIISALKSVREKLAVIGNVSKVELEAGLKFVGEAGIVLSKVGSEASISIKLVWEQDGGSEK
jgi:hypothetical protein